MDFDELSDWNDRMVEKYHSEGTLFQSANPILRYVERLRAKSIIKLANVRDSDCVIDVGCGEGYITSLLPRASRIVGLDISRVALDNAKKSLQDRGEVEFVLGDAQGLDFEDASFDVALCSELLEHVPDPRAVTKELRRILKPSGTLVVSIPDESRIKRIMRIIKALRVDRFLHAARKSETYEWHLHEADMAFLKSISADDFRIGSVRRVPPIVGYRYVVRMEPL
jgi:ubiquinone/menaquinone biosynthesis C-methylase UbiE